MMYKLNLESINVVTASFINKIDSLLNYVI